MTMDAPVRRRGLATPRGVVLLLLLTAMLFSSVYPMRRTFDVKVKIAALRTEERSLDRQASALQAEMDLLATDEEVERIAREDLGYVRPGEVPFVVAKPPAKGPKPAALDQRPIAQTRRDTPLLRRWLDAFARTAGSMR